MTATFIPAQHLSKRLASVVEPWLRSLFPHEGFTLAFLGAGSDVLGFDTARSMDHDWGPRLTIVVTDSKVEHVRTRIDRELHDLLPPTIGGFPTRFSRHSDGTHYTDADGAIHRLEVVSITSLLQQRLLIDDPTDLADAVWLSTPMQLLLELTAGAVFVDDAGDLTRLRKHLAFYPDHVWRFQLAGLWNRVNQVNPFIGRTGEVGDEPGSVVIAASIARDLMRIALLQSGRYAPYSKWLGSAFRQLPIADQIDSYLHNALLAPKWSEREAAINAAASVLIGQLNSLRIIPPVSPESRQFHSRPFKVVAAEQIVDHLRASLEGSGLENFQSTMGGIDVITDSTDALGSHEFRRAVREMFRTALTDS